VPIASAGGLAFAGRKWRRSNAGLGAAAAAGRGEGRSDRRWRLFVRPVPCSAGVYPGGGGGGRPEDTASGSPSASTEVRRTTKPMSRSYLRTSVVRKLPSSNELVCSTIPRCLAPAEFPPSIFPPFGDTDPALPDHRAVTSHALFRRNAIHKLSQERRRRPMRVEQDPGTQLTSRTGAETGSPTMRMAARVGTRSG
jgi:hypothetical protein